MLKLVMIVVISLSKSDQRHQPRIAGAAFGGIRARTQVVTERIDTKRAMLKNNHAGNPGDQESTQGRFPTAPNKPDGGRQSKSD
jgi:hypothetical protein